MKLMSRSAYLSNSLIFMKGDIVKVISNLEDFSSKIKENLDELDFERKKQIVRLLVEEVEIDTIKEEINVKHIIPLDNRKCQLCSGTRFTNISQYISAQCR